MKPMEHYEGGVSPELPDNTILRSRSTTNAVINRVTSTGGTLRNNPMPCAFTILVLIAVSSWK